MTGTRSGEDARFTVLVVCTANICRSPAAERLLRAALGPGSGVQVGSAGVRARVGEPMAAGMAECMGSAQDDFAARQIGPELIGGADLVLTMTRAQRAAVVGAVPEVVRRAFTLREFAELARLADREQAVPAGTGAQRLAGLTTVAPRYRSRRSPGPGDDVADPYGGGPADYSRALGEIRDAVAALVPASPSFG